MLNEIIDNLGFKHFLTIFLNLNLLNCLHINYELHSCLVNALIFFAHFQTIHYKFCKYVFDISNLFQDELVNQQKYHPTGNFS